MPSEGDQEAPAATKPFRWLLGFAVLGVAAMLLALALTPKVSVSAFGQTVQVGAVQPSLRLGLSGPGQADLFGEGTIDTVQHFDGPIRPRIVWERFNRNDDASQFIQSTSTGGRRVVRTGSKEVGAALASGYEGYFRRLLLVAALIGGLLYLLSVGVVALAAGHDHKHRSRRRHTTLLVSSVVSALLVTGAFTALTVATAVQQLGTVKSLADLVGTADVVPVPVAVGPSRTDVSVVVIGDSTAAGIGNSPLPKPTAQDKACRRSSDAYALALQSAAQVKVLNLACSSATIADGLLGPQEAGSITLPPQVGVLQSVQSVSLVIVSIGANDVGWSDFMRYCFGLPRCDDQASDSLFRSRLDAFKIQYAQLLQQRRSRARHSQLRTSSCPRPASCRSQGKFRARARSGARSGAGAAVAGSVSVGDQSSRLYMDRGGRVLGWPLFAGAVFVPSLGGESCRDALRICSLRRRGLCALHHRKWEPRSVARNRSREKRRGAAGHGR